MMSALSMTAQPCAIALVQQVFLSGSRFRQPPTHPLTRTRHSAIVFSCLIPISPCVHPSYNAFDVWKAHQHHLLAMLSSNSSGELHVLRHDRHSFRMDGTQIAIFK
mmetsp:Transcript_21843/g.60831  ORF Transcript_21843/g.60831 Transcript_21843/m.60831 type:complete len:106 (-) Transcript_21843:2892-3209(-)